MDNPSTLEQITVKVIYQTDLRKFCEHKFNHILSFTTVQ